MAVYDVILFGATGFTGGLMLKYLASKTSVKYAICGRNRGKMEQAVDAGIEGPEGPGVVDGGYLSWRFQLGIILGFLVSSFFGAENAMI